MKKIIFTITTGLLSLGLFAQESNFLVASSQSNSTITTTSSQSPCSQGSLADFNYAISGINAFDLDVAANDTFEVSKLTFQYLTIDNSSVDEVTIVVFESDNNLPSTVMHTFSDVMLDNQSVVGVFDTGTAQYDIVEAEFSFTAPFVLSEGKYWMSVYGSSVTSEDMYVISNSQSSNFINEPAASYDTDDDIWTSSTAGTAFEILYLIEGDCLLSTDQNILSQVSVYPNPATNFINVNVPANVQITGAVLYDVLGKNTGAAISNGQINVANLSRGVYMLSLETSAGTLVKKIVKQ